MSLLNEILTVCKSGNRIVPKRNIDWVEINHPDLYSKINRVFPNTSIKDIISYLSHNINSISEIPKCSVCDNKVHLSGKKLLTECSISCAQKSEKVKEKIEETCVNRYGKKRNFGDSKGKYSVGEHHTQKDLKNLEDLKNTDKVNALVNKGWREVAKHFGLTEKSHSSAIRFIRNNTNNEFNTYQASTGESEVYNYILSLGFDVDKNSRNIIPPKELDIYIPSNNIAIEYNGIYWHSSGNKENDNEKNRFHIDKTDQCEAKDIHLLHIFENEWMDDNKQNIWKSVIRHKLGLSKKIYARKCKVSKIENKIANDFIEKNHLQGKANCSLSYGLFYNDKLVQVATFGNPRYTNGYDYELIRLCSMNGYCIIGGASKLLKMIKGSIISYANRRWSFGNVYDTIGFKLVGKSKPCYWYIKNNVVYHRSSFMKHKLKNKLDNFDDSLTEVENCYNNGLRRIWDCGNLIYERKALNED